MRKSVVFLAILAVLAGAGIYLQRSGEWQVLWAAISSRAPATAGTDTSRRAAGAAKSPVEVAAASVKKLSDDISAIGNLLSDESVQIATETSGRIAEITFKEGDTVAAGAVLIKLDDSLNLSAQADAKARLALAQANFDRANTLRKSGISAQSTLDTAISELAVANSALDLIETQEEKLSLKAPFPGVLGFRTVSPGAYVTAGTALVNLEKIDRLKVTFSVPELYLQRLSKGQKISVRADALPGIEFEGTIYAIDPAIDVNGLAVKVRATLDNRDGKLRPGLLARITVKGPPRDAVTVPESALVPRGNDVLVYRTDKGKALETKVVAGRRENGFVEIIEGVEAGQSIVTAGQQRLRDGSDVEIVSSPLAATES
ncbi:efflux RND transporter periplasmic adaptor subunit [soil metagenome]